MTGVSAEVSIQAPSPNEICANTPFQLQAINLNPGDILTYQWASVPPGVVFSPNANVANPVATAPAGTFTITLHATNQFNCTADISVPLNVLPGESLAGQIDANLCNGLEVQFTNSSNIDGTWYFGTGDCRSGP